MLLFVVISCCLMFVVVGRCSCSGMYVWRVGCCLFLVVVVCCELSSVVCYRWLFVVVFCLLFVVCVFVCLFVMCCFWFVVVCCLLLFIGCVCSSVVVVRWLFCRSLCDVPSLFCVGCWCVFNVVVSKCCSLLLFVDVVYCCRWVFVWACVACLSLFVV